MVDAIAFTLLALGALGIDNGCLEMESMMRLDSERDFMEWGTHQSHIKTLLDKEAAKRNDPQELSYARPDPLLVASRYRDESIALICALFGYGNAGLIVKFLERLDFSLLGCSEVEIRDALEGYYYRFQKSEDVAALFIALKRLREIDSLEDIFYEGYKKEESILDGLWALIGALQRVSRHESYGYRFLTGTIPKDPLKAGTYKRYMMYLRWMVREDSLDMGLWRKIGKERLLIPLDTHTFQVSRALGLLERKSYDMKAVLELTERLKAFDPDDPVKYDFALYRPRQEGLVRQSVGI